MSIVEKDLEQLKEKNVDILKEKDEILLEIEKFTRNANREIDYLKVKM